MCPRATQSFRHSVTRSCYTVSRLPAAACWRSASNRCRLHDMPQVGDPWVGDTGSALRTLGNGSPTATEGRGQADRTMAVTASAALPVLLAEERMAALQAQVDRLEADKADVLLVSQYTGTVADTFEQLAATVADSTQTSIAQLMAQQQEVLIHGRGGARVKGRPGNATMLASGV